MMDLPTAHAFPLGLSAATADGADGANAAQGVAANPQDADARLKAKATEAAVKFEAFFIKQMISQMRAGTRALADEDSPDKKAVNQDMLDLADGLVADALAQQRAFGIADLMLKQVLPTVLSSGAAGSPSSNDTGTSP